MKHANCDPDETPAACVYCTANEVKVIYSWKLPCPAERLNLMTTAVPGGALRRTITTVLRLPYPGGSARCLSDLFGLSWDDEHG